MDLFEALHTQRSVRRFKPDPVPDDLLHKVLDAAIRAPSGGNSQPWVFMVLKDPQVKQQVGALYKRAWDAAGVGHFLNDPDPSRARVYRTAQYLAEHMGEAPILIVACIKHDGSPSTIFRGSSIYPAIQNLMVAARGLGLGTVLTAVHREYEKELKELLRIPENVETAALIPLGYPADGTRFGPVKRRPVEEVTFLDRWEQQIWSAGKAT